MARSSVWADGFTPRRSTPCGASHIAAGKKCHVGVNAASKTAEPKRKFPTKTALGVAAGAALTAGAVYGYRRRSRVIPASVTVMRGTGSLIQPGVQKRLTGRSSTPQPRLPGDRTTRRLRGTTPKGLLPPSPPKQSKTARMRANTGAAVRRAEQRIAQTARQEVRRLGQIGLTMAETGEATGMVAKTGWREVRLRVEAARRKYEPGFRKGRRFQPQPRLTGSTADPVRPTVLPKKLDPLALRRKAT